MAWLSGARLWIAGYAAGVLLVGIGMGSFNLPYYSRLEAHGANVKARVTATECGNHGTVVYEFRAAEGTYTGRSNAGFATPPCQRLKAGDPVTVRYLLADPTRSVLGSIDDRLWNEWVSVVLAALVLPLVVVGIVRHRARRRYIKESR